MFNLIKDDYRDATDDLDWRWLLVALAILVVIFWK